jgi:hypothetical protein
VAKEEALHCVIRRLQVQVAVQRYFPNSQLMLKSRRLGLLFARDLEDQIATTPLLRFQPRVDIAVQPLVHIVAQLWGDIAAKPLVNKARFKFIKAYKYITNHKMYCTYSTTNKKAA